MPMPGIGGADGAGSLAVTAYSLGGAAEVTAVAGKPDGSVVVLVDAMFVSVVWSTVV